MIGLDRVESWYLVRLQDRKCQVQLLPAYMSGDERHTIREKLIDPTLIRMPKTLCGNAQRPKCYARQTRECKLSMEIPVAVRRHPTRRWATSTKSIRWWQRIHCMMARRGRARDSNADVQLLEVVKVVDIRGNRKQDAIDSAEVVYLVQYSDDGLHWSSGYKA